MICIDANGSIADGSPGHLLERSPAAPRAPGCSLGPGGDQGGGCQVGWVLAVDTRDTMG